MEFLNCRVRLTLSKPMPCVDSVTNQRRPQLRIANHRLKWPKFKLINLIDGCALLFLFFISTSVLPNSLMPLQSAYAQTLQQAMVPSRLQMGFIKSMDSHTVRENTPVDTIVYKLEAQTDPYVPGVRILYDIEGTQLFNVDKLTGQVRVAQSIDRELVGDSINFQVIATPYFLNQASAPARLSISVIILDENDNPPKFERVRVGLQEYNSQALTRIASTTGGVSIVRLNISEEAPIQSVLVDDIEASDADKTFSNRLSAVCLECEPEFKLVENEHNWSLVLVKQLVHSPRDNVRPLHVTISDGKYNTTIVFEVTIDDVQNRAPHFVSSTTCIVNENTPIDTTILTIKAIDGDTIAPEDGTIEPLVGRDYVGRQIVYDFIDQTNGRSSSRQEDFKLHPLTGQLQVASRLDRESYLNVNGVLSLQVRARELTVDAGTVVVSDELYETTLAKLIDLIDPSDSSVSVGEITVMLVDVNDNSPRWLNASEISIMNKSPVWYRNLPTDRTDTGRVYSLRVHENTLPGTPITTRNEMFVYDLDAGDNAEFNITLDDKFNLFDVEPKQVSGMASVTIKLANNNKRPANKPLLDYENINERNYIIELIAIETKTREQLRSKAQIQISVVDVNDNAPEFKESSYVANIREDAPVGKTVKHVQATDRDEVSRQLRYSLHGHSVHLFDINSSSGLVTVARCEAPLVRPVRFNAAATAAAPQRPCIDYESQRTHHLMVEASDGELSSKVPLTIWIEDASDNGPVFTVPILDVVIEEGAERIDPPIKIEATDVDQTSTLTYSIVEGNFEGLFAMNNATGELQLTRPIRIAHDDLSSMSASGEQFSFKQQQLNKMTLIVQASDGVHATNGTIRIDILDANDNAPVFSRPSYEKEITDLYSPGQSVMTVRAFDSDRGNNARVSYRIERGSHGQFDINETSGEIVVSPSAPRRFDANKRDHYTLEVVAYDHGLISKSSSVLVVIKVASTSRLAPQFEPRIQRVTINESTPNSTIVHRMIVHDQTSTQQNQALTSVVFQPGPIEGLDKHGQPVLNLARLETMFRVSADTGDVVVFSGLDHDFASFINLTIFAYYQTISGLNTSLHQSSNGNNNAVEEFSPKSVGYLVISVVDNNDHAPQFAAPWTQSSPELSYQMLEELPVGSILAHLVASDKDSKISHFEIEPPNEYFELMSPQSGVIVNKKIIDYDTLMRQTFLTPGAHRATASNNQFGGLIAHSSNNIIQFNVIVYDSGVKQLSAKAIVSVEIMPINDNECKFELPVYEVHVRENAHPDTVIAQVRATDLDYGEQHNSVAYQLIGDRRDLFNIDARTGVVTVSQRGSIGLDREQLDQPFILLTVIGRDEQLSHQRQQTESPFSYKASSLSRQRSGSVTTTSDVQSSGRSCSAVLKIHVDDINDNPPLFSQKLYEVTAYDTDVTEMPLVKLHVRDADQSFSLPPSMGGNNSSRVSTNSFIILSGNINDTFNISSTGVIYLTKALGRIAAEHMADYVELKVQVRQQSAAGTIGQGHQLLHNVPAIFTDECRVRIHMAKINRYAPEWQIESLKSISVRENERPGTLIAQLKCTDRDFELKSGRFVTTHDRLESTTLSDTSMTKFATNSPNLQSASQIKYWIKENGTNVLETREFKLNATSGSLFTRIELDREMQEFYHLIVSCEDNGKLQSLESITPLYIKVLDVDDNEAEFVVPKQESHMQLTNVAERSIQSTVVNQKYHHQLASITFSVEEHQSKGLQVGELRAIDRDLESSYSISYCLLGGNEMGEFQLDQLTGILYTNQTLDREKHLSHELLVKAINDGRSCVDHKVALDALLKSQTQEQQTTTGVGMDSRDNLWSRITQKSFVRVRVNVLDINDNAALFRRQVHRAGVHHRAPLHSLVTQVAALDPDDGLNGTLSYRISEILLYKTNPRLQQQAGHSRNRQQFNSFDSNNIEQQILSKPIKLIQSPFKIDQQGNIYTQQLLTQYQLMSMFVIHIEATEQADPWRMVSTKLEIYVYETNQQLKIRINLHPKFIDVFQYEIESLLSNATKYTAIINRARSYHDANDRNQVSSQNSKLSRTTSQRVPILDLISQNNLSPTMDANNQVPSQLDSSSSGGGNNNEPNYSNILTIFIENHRVVSPQSVMEKFDLTSAQLFTPQSLAQQLSANNKYNDAILNKYNDDLMRQNSAEVSSLIDKIALASTQTNDYGGGISTLAGIDWLETPPVLFLCLTLMLVTLGIVICLVGCCCTSRIKDHIIKVAMDKLVKQQTLQAKINERVLAATNQAYTQSANAANGNDFILQQGGGMMSSFDVTKGCMNNNYENMNILQRALEAGEYIDPNYTTLNGHINLGAHYYDSSELEQQQHQIDAIEGTNGLTKQVNGSVISVSLVDENDDNGETIYNTDNMNGTDLNNGQHLVNNNKARLYSNGVNGLVSSHSRQRQQVPPNGDAYPTQM